MKFINSRVIYSLIFYVLSIILVTVVRPACMFRSNGSMIYFGVGGEHTVFPFGVFALVLAIISFYIFTVIDLIFK